MRVLDFHIVHAESIRDTRLVWDASAGELFTFTRTIARTHINRGLRRPLRWIRQYHRRNVSALKLAHETARLIESNYSRGLSPLSRVLETRPNAFNY